VRLDKIAKEYAGSCDVRWKSFLLRPRPEPRSLEEFRAYTESWRRPAAQEESGRFTVWSTDEAPPSHSVPPAVAAKAAARQGPESFERYHLALMENYFHRNHNITDPANLVRIAEETGLDVATFVAALREPSVGREVVDDHNEAVSLGIGGVPTVIVDDRWRVSGAQPSDVYRRIVEMRLAGESLG
jgi:predicted DsbA family dithiol-disulfide isomerase